MRKGLEAATLRAGRAVAVRPAALLQQRRAQSTLESDPSKYHTLDVSTPLTTRLWLALGVAGFATCWGQILAAVYDASVNPEEEDEDDEDEEEEEDDD